MSDFDLRLIVLLTGVINALTIGMQIVRMRREAGSYTPVETVGWVLMAASIGLIVVAAWPPR